MIAVILIGIPATGKSTFCRQRFSESLTTISLDVLKTRKREQVLLDTCITNKEDFVIDNTNVSAAERERFITPARAAGYWIAGYFFRSKLEEALERNRQRLGAERIREQGIFGAAGRLQLPTWAEGFDELWYVRMDGDGGFVVEAWNDEV